MNIIFLRGSIPPRHEHPKKVLYNCIENCSDVWTQLFYYLSKKFKAKAELLYQSDFEKRKFVVNSRFREKWLSKLETYKPSFYPDLIVCRGGFSYYDNFLKQYPKAKKVYYGAGTRYYPQSNFDTYDLFLVDSKKQKKEIKRKGKRVKLFIKPAATLFRPYNTKKKYDICFIANASQGTIKRHKLLLKTFSNTKYSILNLGNNSKEYVNKAKKLNVDINWAGWFLRKYLPEKISSCKVGVCCSTNYDSCPRVIPEYLACGIPVVATNNMNFWHEKYITEETGILVNGKNIMNGVEKMLNCDGNIKKYYDDNICMEKAVDHLYKLIKNIL